MKLELKFMNILSGPEFICPAGIDIKPIGKVKKLVNGSICL
jgi:hypothetical protein